MDIDDNDFLVHLPWYYIYKNFSILYSNVSFYMKIKIFVLFVFINICGWGYENIKYIVTLVALNFPHPKERIYFLKIFWISSLTAKFNFWWDKDDHDVHEFLRSTSYLFEVSCTSLSPVPIKILSKIVKTNRFLKNMILSKSSKPMQIWYI